MVAVRAICSFRDYEPGLQPASGPVTGRQADENLPFSRHDTCRQPVDQGAPISDSANGTATGLKPGTIKLDSALTVS